MSVIKDCAVLVTAVGLNLVSNYGRLFLTMEYKFTNGLLPEYQFRISVTYEARSGDESLICLKVGEGQSGRFQSSV